MYFIFLHLLLAALVNTQEEQSCALDGTCERQPCIDTLNSCRMWAEKGECHSDNVAFMLKRCAYSCGACGPCVDDEDECFEWAQSGECGVNPQYMLRFCRKSCSMCEVPPTHEDFGEEQVHDGEQAEEVQKALTDMYLYFKNHREDPNTPISTHILLDNCSNRHSNCAFWKVLGECDVNPGYMKIHCAAACQTCDLLDFNARCPLDPNAINAWGPGDLDTFFINITTLPEFQEYEPVVHSRPSYVGDDTAETAQYKIGPWVVTLDRFVTDEEADRLVDLGATLGYERSADVGEMNFDGSFESNVNDGRTSTNAWCEGPCSDDFLAKQVMNRIENVTFISYNFSEPLQLLRYEIGQYYKPHHDYIEHDFDRQAGPRILTVFLYLNDVTAGGGTNFPLLDITIMPKKGRALIWPSVLDEDPQRKDPRTDHQALPVEEGIKYGANAWVHLRNISAAREAGCL